MARSRSGTNTGPGWTTTVGPPRWPWPCLSLWPLSLSLSAQAGDASPNMRAGTTKTSARRMKKASLRHLERGACLHFGLNRTDPEGLWQNGDLQGQASDGLAIEVDEGFHLRVEAKGGAAGRPHRGMPDVRAAVELGQDVRQYLQPRHAARLDQVEHPIIEA